MTIQQNYGFRPHLETSFTATGRIGPEYVVSNTMNTLGIVVENTSVGNTILVKGRLTGQTAWVTLGTIIGPTTGTKIELGQTDEISFECTVYSASGGTPKLIASGFFKPTVADQTSATNIGSGDGLYAGEVNDELQFKSLVAGTNITITPSSTEVEISTTVNSVPRLTVIFDTDVFTVSGDLVRLTAADFVETITDNSDTTIPNGLFGVAFAKPTSVTVEVMFLGILGGYSGLTPGQAVFIGTLGVPTHTPPATGTLQQIGFAITTTEIFFQFGQAMRRA